MFTLAARAAARHAAPAYRRTLATAAAAAERSPGGVQAMHWVSGGSMLSCVGLVLVSERSAISRALALSCLLCQQRYYFARRCSRLLLVRQCR